MYQIFNKVEDPKGRNKWDELIKKIIKIQKLKLIVKNKQLAVIFLKNRVMFLYKVKFTGKSRAYDSHF